MEYELHLLREAPASVHDKYLLLRSLVLPRVNYGPLVEITDGDSQSAKAYYIEIDKLIDDYLTNELLNLKSVPENDRKDFYLDPEEGGGLGIMEPGAYYNEFKE